MGLYIPRIEDTRDRIAEHVSVSDSRAADHGSKNMERRVGDRQMSFLRAAARLVFMHLNSAARSVTIIQVIQVRQYKLRDNNIPPR